MAVAFFIPDQATLLREAEQKEQQILRMRETQWRLLATVVLETLRLYSPCPPKVGRKCGKYRKPSQ
ncbi:cell death protein rpr [Drosophila eugracilis]|uniref:cell death protein rpr n=1 Tax=Drosophila eugracilis TaxID=29029 RepID=UPI0007E8AB31|nr:cell death protein rpr [Drosophila eugracilis]